MMTAGRFDPYTPNQARIYDYWRGGHDNWQADRDLAAAIERLYPAVRQMATANVLFAGRAVTWAAIQHRIRMFIDLGTGLPSGESVHRIARAVAPAARVAYVDTDPEAAREARRILRDAGDGVVFAEADLRDPGAVLADPSVGKLLSAGEPAMVLLTLVLQSMAAAKAREVVAAWAARLAPGSIIALSVPHNEDQESFEAVRALWPGELHNHSRDDALSFFGGLQLVPPGLVLARGWRGDMPDADLPPGPPVYVLGGAGRKILGAVRTAYRGPPAPSLQP